MVYRLVNGTIEVLVCGRESPLLWGLPKGTPNPGESLEETALREVREETGLAVELETPIDRIIYWFVRGEDGVRCHKTVHFYLMRPVGGSLEAHDPEFDVVRWFPAGEALRTLTYANEAGVAEKGVNLVQQRYRS